MFGRSLLSPFSFRILSPSLPFFSLLSPTVSTLPVHFLPTSSASLSLPIFVSYILLSALNSTYYFSSPTTSHNIAWKFIVTIFGSLSSFFKIKVYSFIALFLCPKGNQVKMLFIFIWYACLFKYLLLMMKEGGVRNKMHDSYLKNKKEKTLRNSSH